MVQIPGEMERERFSNLSKERALRGYAESPQRETGQGRYKGWAEWLWDCAVTVAAAAADWRSEPSPPAQTWSEAAFDFFCLGKRQPCCRIMSLSLSIPHPTWSTKALPQLFLSPGALVTMVWWGRPVRPRDSSLCCKGI